MMEQTPVFVPNTVIDASAGCGKTEVLGIRMAAMLLAGISPDSMITMTFTRAAASEIYGRLLQLLYDAALSETKRTILETSVRNVGLEAPEECFVLTPERLKSLLRDVVRNMNRLKIGTLDSFMMQIVQCFPVELGLPGEAHLLDEHEGMLLQYDLLRTLLNTEGDVEFDDDFIAAARDASFGNDQKMIFDASAELIETTQKYDSLREREDIWCHFCRPPRTAPSALLQAWEEMEHFFEAPVFLGKVMNRSTTAARGRELMELLKHCRDAKSDTVFSRSELETLRAFFKCWDTLDAGPFKPKSFSWADSFFPETRCALKLLLGHARDILLFQGAVRTGGMRKMLCRYAALYRKKVLNEGRMVFADLPRLLNSEAADSWILDIAYRLNGKLKHWLIDEFQDTSRDQWQVLNRIIDDTLDGEHSLFIVGDVKQAIYTWREGDSRLMGEVAEQYSLNPVPLNRSYRYGMAISESLNHIFSKESLLRSALPEETKLRWNQIWKRHESVPGVTGNGEFSVVQLLKQADDERSDMERYAELIVGKLRKIEPWKRSLSAAVLVRSKSDGLELKNAVSEWAPELARHFIWEGDESIGSDRRVSALLALTVYLQHPGSTVYREVAAMTPELFEQIPESPDAQNFMLSELMCSGFYKFLNRMLPETWRSDDNLQTLLAAARTFDSSGMPRDSIVFREFVSSYRQSENALNGKVRIMTIHHSKGLGFDIVFTALRNNSRTPSLRKASYTGFVAGKSVPGGEIRWLLYQPREEGATLPEIRTGAESRWGDESFEALCTLYVALTRAKRCVCVLLPFLTKSKLEAFEAGRTLAEGDQSYYPSDFLFDSLSSEMRRLSWHGSEILLYDSGDKDWFRPVEAKEDFHLPSLALHSCNGKTRRRRLRPSQLEESETLKLYFRLPDTGSGAELGTELHRILENVESPDTFEIPAGLSPEVMAHLRACFGSFEFRSVMNLPDAPYRLWREQHFETILDSGEWVSGSFDRVLIEYNADGTQILRARLIDFKSNEVSAETRTETAAKYRPQMMLYRKVLTAMLNLKPAEIDVYLIFTKLGCSVKMEC